MPDPRRVLVMLPNWLGDAVMALPAAADVKRRFPSAAVVAAGRASVSGFYRLSASVDEVLTLEWRGRLLDRRGWRRDVAAIAAADADVAILLPNSFASAWLVRRAGVAERWGYAADARRPLLTRAVRRPRGRRHQGEYYQHLVRALGAPSGPPAPSIDVPAAVLDAARDVLASHGWEGRRPLVVVAPGAAYGTAKRWLPEHFVELIARLAGERGADCVLVGSRDDAGTTAWIVGAVPGHVRAHLIDLTGATTIETLAGVMSLASACVSNDSGALHVAAAVGVPSAGLFGPTRERETAPRAAPGRRVEVLVHAVWCRPCMLRECPIDHRCMKGLTPERVFAVVSDLMAGPAASGAAR
jgi:heptosyltransferase-2